MSERFDYMNEDIVVHEIGRLNDRVITLLEVELTPRKIIIGKDKIKYIEKHKPKYKSEEDYARHIESLPEVISEPDYVALHPNGQSIEFIKKLDEILLIAVRVKAKGDLWVKSVFPITKDKLESYKKSGRLKNYK